MIIEQKYGIKYINNKRFYEIDMINHLFLDETVPHAFIHNNHEIYEGSWNRLTLKILEYIDKITSLEPEELLKIQYTWSKQPVFSSTERINFTPFKGIYLNTNHTSTHARMSIQCLLNAYGVNLIECKMIIRRHPKSEPSEVREYYKNKMTSSFINYLSFKGFNTEKIQTIVTNLNAINKFLSKVSPGYDDFFLFDDHNYYNNYKIKTIEFVGKKYPDSSYYKITIKTLSYFDEFFRLRHFFDDVNLVNAAISLKNIIQNEINFLFDKLNTSVISSSKLYSRLKMIYSSDMDLLGSFNNQSNFYYLTKIMLGKYFIFKDPFISKDENIDLNSEQIIMSYIYGFNSFTIKMINAYTDKMHLKRPDNYLKLMIECSDDFVQVDQNQMVRKEVLDLKRDVLDRIEIEINFYLNSFGKIHSENFNDYDSYPFIDYIWNIYLLVGIIRTYFSEKYYIQYTTKKYKDTDFVIFKK